MSSSIHPTAIVEEKVTLEEGCSVGPFAIIEKGAILGRGCVVNAHAVIKGFATLREAVEIDHFAVVGGNPQHLGFDPSTPSRVDVGEGTRIGEGVTLHRSIEKGGVTRIGKSCFLMGYSHVAHDCTIGESCVLANGALLGGHVSLGKRVFIGGGAAVHQFARIGSGVMVGGLAEISVDIPPFLMVTGRNQSSGLNLTGLKRQGTSPESISELKRCYLDLIKNYGSPAKRSRQMLEEGTFTSTEAKEFLGFLGMQKRRYVHHRT
jgi:UDP-N-acetylglucosamine acyltransferase